MTKIEFVELVRSDMFEAIKLRDKTDVLSFSESYGFYHGQFKAYESILKLLTMFSIDELDSVDSRMCGL